LINTALVYNNALFTGTKVSGMYNEQKAVLNQMDPIIIDLINYPFSIIRYGYLPEIEMQTLLLHLQNLMNKKLVIIITMVQNGTTHSFL
jgi:hypothetical protein